jgi:membrane protein
VTNSIGNELYFTALSNWASVDDEPVALPAASGFSHRFNTSIRWDEGADAMLWTVAKEAAANWSSHKDSRQGAALAYYSVFSLGPIIVIAIAVAGFFFGRDAVSGQVASSTKDMLGDTGAQAIQAMLADAGRPREGLLATLLGLGALIFTAIGVVVQLKDALNTVWEVAETPGDGVWHFIRSYVVSLAAVLALGFLLLVSLLVTAGLAAFGKYAAPHLQEWFLHLDDRFHETCIMEPMG